MGDRLDRWADPPLLVLASLAAEPKHGYAITQDVAETMGVRLSAGTLYAVISRLESRGLIEPLPSDDRRRPYRLTAAGATELARQSARMSRVASLATQRLQANLGWAARPGPAPPCPGQASVTPTIQDAAVRAAVSVAARHGITAAEPAVLADGANIVVHLRPAPVVAKVAASTPAVRRPVADWLQRELDVSAFLAADGPPVVPPSPELPATTHHDDSHVMSFWRYLPPADPTGPKRPDEETIGSMLRDLHAALRRYPKTPPTLAPLQDIPAFLARPQARVSQEGKAALAAAYQRLTAELDPAADQQVLHGDAGAGNLMATDRGWVWHDFEDTCSGPVAWDLAASTASRYQDGPRVVAAYRDPVDQHQLAVCEQLRWLHLTVWYNLYAERLPELAPRAAELLAGWAMISPVN